MARAAAHWRRGAVVKQTVRRLAEHQGNDRCRTRCDFQSATCRWRNSGRGRGRHERAALLPGRGRAACAERYGQPSESFMLVSPESCWYLCRNSTKNTCHYCRETLGCVRQKGVVGIALSVPGAKKRWYQQRYQEKTSMGKVALGWYGKIRKTEILIFIQ